MWSTPSRRFPNAGSQFSSTPSPRSRDTGPQGSSTPSPRFTSKKLASPLRCLSLKKFEEPGDETEQLQELPNSPLQDLEVAYAAHICLTWELLHCQYTYLSQKISVEPENSCTYNYSAQQFQQFQVLLQRFVENEPFEQGHRPEIYAQTRKSLPKLLHVPMVQGKTHFGFLYSWICRSVIKISALKTWKLAITLKSVFFKYYLWILFSWCSEVSCQL